MTEPTMRQIRAAVSAVIEEVMIPAGFIRYDKKNWYRDEERSRSILRMDPASSGALYIEMYAAYPAIIYWVHRRPWDPSTLQYSFISERLSDPRGSQNWSDIFPEALEELRTALRVNALTWFALAADPAWLLNPDCLFYHPVYEPIFRAVLTAAPGEPPEETARRAGPTPDWSKFGN
jgi:hypothetical protein